MFHHARLSVRQRRRVNRQRTCWCGRSAVDSDHDTVQGDVESASLPADTSTEQHTRRSLAVVSSDYRAGLLVVTQRTVSIDHGTVQGEVGSASLPADTTTERCNSKFLAVVSSDYPAGLLVVTTDGWAVSSVVQSDVESASVPADASTSGPRRCPVLLWTPDDTRTPRDTPLVLVKQLTSRTLKLVVGFVLLCRLHITNEILQI